MIDRANRPKPCKHCSKAKEHEIHTAQYPSPGFHLYEPARIFVASPSSVKTYQKCPRQWAVKALGGIRIETPAQRFGTLLHAMAEEYLKNGTIPDQSIPEGRLMVEGIPYLPKPGTCEIEGEISFNLNGVPWIGYYDFRVPAECRIGDHKSSSDPKRWGLTSKTLALDVQGAAYAWGSGYNETLLDWIYYSKKSANAFPVQARMTRTQAQQILDETKQITHEMQDAYNANPVRLNVEQLNQIPNNPESCGHCGRGCDFANDCRFIAPATLVRKAIDMSEADERAARIEKLKAEVAAKRAAQAAGAKAPESAPAVNPPKEEEKALEDTKQEIANDVAPGDVAVTDDASTGSPAAINAPAEDKPEEKKRGPGRPPGSGKKADVAASGVADALATMIAFARANGVEITIRIPAV